MSWNQLISLKQEFVAMRLEDLRQPIVACPNCGIPLVQNKDGVKNCPAGDFRLG